MRDEILLTLQQMIQALTGASVVIGSMPPNEGFAVSFAGGAPLETFRTLSTNESLPVLFNGKGGDQESLAQQMDAVHQALTTSKVLPYCASWQIYAIETTAAPQLVGRELNSYWIYGSSLRIKYYAKGGQDA